MLPVRWDARIWYYFYSYLAMMTADNVDCFKIVEMAVPVPGAAGSTGSTAASASRASSGDIGEVAAAAAAAALIAGGDRQLHLQQSSPTAGMLSPAAPSSSASSPRAQRSAQPDPAVGTSATAAASSSSSSSSSATFAFPPPGTGGTAGGSAAAAAGSPARARSTGVPTALGVSLLQRLSEFLRLACQIDPHVPTHRVQARELKNSIKALTCLLKVKSNKKKIK